MRCPLKHKVTFINYSSTANAVPLLSQEKAKVTFATKKRKRPLCVILSASGVEPVGRCEASGSHKFLMLKKDTEICYEIPAVLRTLICSVTLRKFRLRLRSAQDDAQWLKIRVAEDVNPYKKRSNLVYAKARATM